MDLLHKVLSLFSERDKGKLILLLGVMVVTATLEVVGVASIMPFMAILTDPGVVNKSQLLSWFVRFFRINNTISLQTIFGIFTLVLLFFSNAAALLMNWMLLKFVHGQGHAISLRLLRSYMSQDYEFFLHRNTVELGKNILTEVQRAMVAVVVPILQLTAKSIVVCFMVLLLVLVNPLLAFGATIVVGALYAIIYIAIRRKLNRYGSIVNKAEEQRFKATSEALGGIKEIKINGRYAFFQKKFQDASLQKSQCNTTVESIAALPKYVLEFIAFGGIVVMALYLLHVNNHPGQVLPIVALFAFAGYRLMPAMQQIFSSLSLIRYHAGVLDIINRDIRPIVELGNRMQDQKNLTFDREFRLSGIFFSYPQGVEVLSDISMTVYPNTTIGLAGKSGTGKTTLVDIILGLLRSSKGEMAVDGVAVDKTNIRSWQALIGYVPQQIHLIDDTIAANIAFGIPAEEINQSLLEHASRLAHLHSFVCSLADGYNTNVGEKGVRLSGGQRQRIGIARALYSDPKILIFDEATSALDNLTESAVMEAIGELSGKKTIIIIAHRLTTLQCCDCIYLMSKGKIISSGKYEELVNDSPEFRALALLQQEGQSA